VRFLIADDAGELAGYDSIPVCSLRRSAADEGQLEIDPDYFPPCLSVMSWPELGLTVLRAGIYDLIRTRVTELALKLRERGIDWSSQRPGDLGLLYLADVLNEALGTLQCLAFGPGAHPFVTYTELCRIIGRLSILGPERKSPDYPRYDHDNLAEIFRWAMREINERSRLPDDRVRRQYFVGSGRVMRVTIPPEWFGPEWKLYVGMHHPEISQPELISILTQQRPNWKFGSFQQVDEIFERRMPGVKVQPLRQVPGPLAALDNWFIMSCSDEGEAWQRVRLENSLAMRVSDEQVYRLGELDGKEEIVFHLAGKLIRLKFALFAVRSQS
jgi:type VI secretion system protein ImpJ